MWFLVCILAGLVLVALSFSSYFENIIDSTQFSLSCKYRGNLTLYVSSHLKAHIIGQDEAVNHLSTAIASWELRRNAGRFEPLVLVITGSTGIGKTETAYKLAEALYPPSTILGNNCGFLLIRGEDYAKSTEIGHAGLNHVQAVLKKQVTQHLLKTSGNALIVFDEVQKIMPGSLQFLSSAIEERGYLNYFQEEFSTQDTINAMYAKFSSYFGNTQQQFIAKNGKEDERQSGPRLSSAQVSTQNAIFVFISDIGSQEIVDALLWYNCDRKTIPRQVLRDHVKSALAEEYFHTQFTKHIKEIVPFLPLERGNIKAILRLKLTELSRDLAGKSWMALSVQDSVIEYLSSEKFVYYEDYEATVKVPGQSEQNVEVDIQGETTATALPFRCNNSFATTGARSLAQGPLLDLESLISFHTSKHPGIDKILHVGLITERNFERCSKAWGNTWRITNDPKNPQLFLQWCKAKIDAFKDIKDEVSNENEKNSADVALEELRIIRLIQRYHSDVQKTIGIDDEYQYSQHCKPIFIGGLYDVHM